MAMSQQEISSHGAKPPGPTCTWLLGYKRTDSSHEDVTARPPCGVYRAARLHGFATVIHGRHQHSLASSRSRPPTASVPGAKTALFPFLRGSDRAGHTKGPPSAHITSSQQAPKSVQSKSRDQKPE
ncbi:hypothetical protein MN608_00824 [Microdochium nivale]|nr:hypothetical protein MN608_00824 [Microdochium nivale]